MSFVPHLGQPIQYTIKIVKRPPLPNTISERFQMEIKYTLFPHFHTNVYL